MRRPRPGEGEDDLLQMQEEFERSGAAAAARVLRTLPPVTLTRQQPKPPASAAARKSTPEHAQPQPKGKDKAADGEVKAKATKEMEQEDQQPKVELCDEEEKEPPVPAPPLEHVLGHVLTGIVEKNPSGRVSFPKAGPLPSMPQRPAPSSAAAARPKSLFALRFDGEAGAAQRPQMPSAPMRVAERDIVAPTPPSDESGPLSRDRLSAEERRHNVQHVAGLIFVA